MNKSNNVSHSDVGGRFTPILLLLFVGSGCSALIYEVVWFHLLRLVIGASAISLGVLLASFMGGMCLGSAALARLVSRRRHPLRVYGLLELGIGVMAIVLLEFLPQVNRLYLTSVGYGYSGILLRGSISLLCLLPPTILMGATLPAIARWMETTRSGISKMGFFYGANIFGAVAGTLLAGFYLLRVFDTVVATYVAVAINVAVCLMGFILAGLGRYQYLQPKEITVVKTRSYPLVYVVIALSGLTALGAEVLWTRLLSLLFGPTVYTFTIILAVFLIGLGLGSSFGSLLARVVERPRMALGWCQLLLVGFIPVTAYMITEIIPYWDMNPDHFADFFYKSIHDLVRGMVALGPSAFLWGASFPLALAAAARSKDQDPGRLVGGVYAANTVGAIAGALLFSLVTVPFWGTQRAQQGLAVVAGVAAVLMFGSALLLARPKTANAVASTRNPSWVGKVMGVVLILLILGFSGLATKLVPPVPAGLIAYGRKVEKWDNDLEYPYCVEGISASVAVSKLPEDITNFHVSGKVVASSDTFDMRLQRMLGHLPGLIHQEPKSVLVVGCGAGVTAGSFMIYPSVERVVICEIEPRVIKGAQDYFGEENYDVLTDARTEIIFDDARHFLSTTKEKFDIITSDPIHPWVRGAAALYSAEYFEICKEHLNPGGIVTQWVPFYESSEAAVKSEIATFMEAFPYGTVWNSDIFMEGYDVVMLGYAERMTIDVDDVQREIDNHPEILQSLQEVELGSAVYMLGTYAGQGGDLTGWLQDAQINTDRSLRLQYLAGLALDYWDTELIFQSLIEHVRYPENIFMASPAREMELREIIK